MIVVTDTSVVLNLAWLRHESLLPRLYDGVLAPPIVRDEFVRLAYSDARFRELEFPAFITIKSPRAISMMLTNDTTLDAGEISALSLALERGIKDILIDERAGRAAALALGLRPSGLLGILVESKERGFIPRVLPLLDSLQDGARFRLGAGLREHILRLTGEGS